MSTFIFCGYFNQFSTVVVPVLLPPGMCEWSHRSISLPRLGVIHLFNYGHSVKASHFYFNLSISLITQEGEYLFISLLAIWVPSFVKCLIESLATWFLFAVMIKEEWNVEHSFPALFIKPFCMLKSQNWDFI